jgi:hypothetical protein
VAQSQSSMNDLHGLYLAANKVRINHKTFVHPRLAKDLCFFHHHSYALN